MTRSSSESRSAVFVQALKLLRDNELERQYEDANREWEGTGEGSLWDHTAGDGLTAPRHIVEAR
jgi:hypothetical protein